MKPRAARTAALFMTLAFGMLLSSGPIKAEETFLTLDGVPSQALTDTEMAKVEGKLLAPVLLALFGPNEFFDLVQELDDTGAFGNLDILDIVLGNGGPADPTTPASAQAFVATADDFNGASPGMLLIFP
jgi:hypothetical protein